MYCDRVFRWAGFTAVVSWALLGTVARGVAGQIVFDLPESIECRDVTPANFAASNYLKVIEGKLRISARIVDGTESEILDFLYLISSPEKTVRFQDYLPNTTLESAVANDQIEIKDATEDARTTGADVHVVYKLLSLGASHNQTAKQSESNHYTQIAPKELVVASGTTNREHGVFFRLRPSRAASLEGAKEFTFLATVPKSWRGDLCDITCSARVKKDSFFSNTVAQGGSQRVELGLYLAGDAEAAARSEELRVAQDAVAALPPLQPHKENTFDAISQQTVGFFVAKKPVAPEAAKQRADAERTLAEAQLKLRQLSR